MREIRRLFGGGGGMGSVRSGRDGGEGKKKGGR